MRFILSSLLLQLGLLAAPALAALPSSRAVKILKVDALQDEQQNGENNNNNNNNNNNEEAVSELEQGEKIFAYPYESYTLESNGLPVVIVPLGDDFPGIVSVHLTIQAGSRNELEEGKTGMAHFFEHMMFRGTQEVSSEEFDSTYLELGASYNAWTWLDMTVRSIVAVVVV